MEGRRLRLLTVPEFCKRYRCSPSTARRRITDGSVRIRQLGGKGTRVLIVDPDDEDDEPNGPPPFSPTSPPPAPPSELGASPGHRRQTPTSCRRHQGGGRKPSWQSRSA